MAWHLAQGIHTPSCDTCGRLYLGLPDRQEMEQFLRAAGWHQATGTTIGGKPYEAVLCPRCARDEHKRRIIKKTTAGDTELPLSWEG